MKKHFLFMVIFLFPLVLQADILFLSNRKAYEGTVTKWDVGKINFVMKGSPLSSFWEVPSERIDKIVVDDSTTYLPFTKYWLNQKDTAFTAKLKETLSKPSDRITAEDLKLLALLKCYRGAEEVNISFAASSQPTPINTIPSIASSTKKDRLPYFLVSALSLMLTYDYLSGASDARDAANILPEGDLKDELNSAASGLTTRGIITIVIGGVSIIAGSVK
ncbi:MAG: hypothetical protein Q7U71_08675 [bacterium]|nr:hypothetical protein [bacterium]